MTRKKLLLTATAAAVLAAFNPAFAGGGAKHGSAEDMSSPSATAEQTLPSPEQSASSSSSNDLNVDQSSGDTERKADAKSSTDISSSAGASSEAPLDQNRSVEPDKLTGLDRAHPAN